MEYRDTSLWKKIVAGDEVLGDAHSPPSYAALIADLRSKAELLGNEISSDLPMFTRHDITHGDKLWELASSLIDVDRELSPGEAAALGVAIYIHDLGMGLAAYTSSVRTNPIDTHPLWRDLVGQRLRAAGMTAIEAQTAPKEMRDLATADALRLLHAEKAQELPSARWGASGHEIYLIENHAFRTNWGYLVGTLAASHGRDLEWVTEHLNEVVTPSGVPQAWSIRTMLVAGILRAADALHIDASRAPALLKAVRSLTGVSATHWNFQAKMTQPTIRNELAAFNSSSPYQADEIEAWWLAYDTLSWVDDELRQTDRALVAHGLPRLEARGVAGVGSPRSATNFLRVDGWTPLETSLRVGDIADLIERLGGTELYGDDASVPMRELIQNSRDAIHARASIEDRSVDNMRVEVSVEARDSLEVLTVADTGVGMTESAILDGLLSFGSSYWASLKAAKDNPGLFESEFSPVGHYGIGFFSVFMLGDQVEVVTRHRSQGPGGTVVLSFDGLRGRPSLRLASATEQLPDPGTIVRVVSQRMSVTGLVQRMRSASDTRSTSLDMAGALSALVGSIAPMMDVPVCTRWGDSPSRESVTPGDWKSLPLEEMANRLWVEDGGGTNDTLREVVYGNLQPLEDQKGQVVARLAIAPNIFINHYPLRGLVGTLCVGGLAAMRMPMVWGLAEGTSSRVSRDAAIPTIDPKTLPAWASEQAHLLAGRIDLPPNAALPLSSFVRWCGGDPGPLPVAVCNDGTLNRDDLIAYLSNRSTLKVGLADDSLILELPGIIRHLLPDCIVTNERSTEFLDTHQLRSYQPWPPRRAVSSMDGNLESLCEAIASAWNVDLEQAKLAVSTSRHRPGAGNTVEIAPTRAVSGFELRRQDILDSVDRSMEGRGS